DRRPGPVIHGDATSPNLSRRRIPPVRKKAWPPGTPCEGCAMTTVADPRATSAVILDRDLSWLEFNCRVLHEALDGRTPLLERVKFPAIFSSNLDEFFMKRIGLLKRKTGAAADASVDGSAPRQRLRRIREAVLPLLAAQAEAWAQVIRPELARNGIRLL